MPIVTTYIAASVFVALSTTFKYVCCVCVFLYAYHSLSQMLHIVVCYICNFLSYTHLSLCICMPMCIYMRARARVCMYMCMRTLEYVVCSVFLTFINSLSMVTKSVHRERQQE